MRFIKKPSPKRNDDTITWDQQRFTDVFRDIPASRIPSGGVADAQNVLLYGDRAMVRPGDEIHNSTYDLPTESTIASGIAKSGATVTDSGNNFTSADVGKFIIWADGTSSMIITFVSEGEVTVDDTTAQSDTSCSIRAQIWGNFWHEKTKQIFVHIGTKLYYAPVDMSADWTEITLAKDSSLGASRTKFDIEENYIYLFNANGIFIIDTTDSSNMFAMKMNMDAPPNTIVPYTDLNDPTGTAYTISFNAEESKLYRYGRRYLYTLTRLDGDTTNNRGDGTRLVKESAPNTYPESNDYKDYKESWGVLNYNHADKTNMGISKYIGLVLNSTGTLSEFNNLGTGSFQVTYTLYDEDYTVLFSEQKQLNFDWSELISWDEIASDIEEKLRETFTLGTDLFCIYSEGDGALLMGDGNPFGKLTGMTGPSEAGVRNFSHTSGRFDEYTDLDFYPVEHPIGSTTVQALEVPSGQNGYTHYSIYSTKTLGKEYNGITNPDYFIWQKDIPIIKPFYLIKDGLTNYLFTNYLDVEDIACDINLASGNILRMKYKGDINRGAVKYNVSETAAYSNVDKNDDVPASPAPAANKLYSAGLFTSADVNKMVFNFDTHESAIVLSQEPGNETNELNLSADIFKTPLETWIIGGEPAAIGSEQPMLATKSGTTVTIISSVRWDVTSDDIGKTVFWEDGTIDIIQSVTGFQEFDTIKSGDKTTPTVLAITFVGRSYNDVLTDDQLEAKAGSFPLLNRFWTKLPDSDIGVVVPGFLSVAPEDSVKGYYSQYSTEYRYLAGHYYPEFQHFILNDPIKEIARIPNQLIIFCKNSTHRFQTNVISSVEDNRVGETIAILSGQGVVDENIGISDRMGVISYGSGFKIVITSEPGIRVFDGYRYSENKLIDDTGRGKMREAFQMLKDRIVAYYEPNLYGIMFWGIQSVNTYNDGTPLLSKSNKCFRLALEPQQGFGFAELSGTKWNFIEVNSSPMHITDSAGDKFTLVFDTNKGYLHRLSTRKLPDVGAANNIDFNHKDNEDVGGGNGTEITWSLKLKEHMAAEENFKLRYMQEYWYLRPFREANKDASGYDSYGFRDAQRITIKKFTDGNSAEVSEAETVNPKATIYQPYKITERRIQTEISGTAGELIITGTRALYDVLRRRADPNEQEETIYQKYFANIIFRLSRGANKKLDLGTGNSPTVDDTIGTIDGPDGVTDSGFNFPSGSSTGLEYAPVVGNEFRQILLSVKLSAATGTARYIYQESIVDQGEYNGVHVSIWANDLTNFIHIDVGDPTYAAFQLDTIAFTPGEWVTIMVTLNSSGVAKANYTTDGGSTYDGGSSNYYIDTTYVSTDDIIIGKNFVAADELFDIVVVNAASDEIPLEGFKYYVRDIYEYAGFSLIPIRET